MTTKRSAVLLLLTCWTALSPQLVQADGLRHGNKVEKTSNEELEDRDLAFEEGLDLDFEEGFNEEDYNFDLEEDLALMNDEDRELAFSNSTSSSNSTQQGIIGGVLAAVGEFPFFVQGNGLVN
jgi:hypothetical protein